MLGRRCLLSAFASSCSASRASTRVKTLPRNTRGRQSRLVAYPFARRFFSTTAMASGSGEIEAGRLNRLAKEKSPYLLQHARNPVDWYPWGKEAFEKAKKENKPIFLSVGYSTCHWCHVMERESFESEEIGALLGRYFVSIKVDREERPDVDRVYMTYIQATEGGGGWPMSVFLTPDLKPFLGGTYFPPHDAFMRPGFATVLSRVAQQWESNHAQLVQQGTRVINILKEVMSTSGGPAQEVPRPQCIEQACTNLVSRFDKKYGGFGFAPKFPQPSILNLLLHNHAHNPGSEQAKEGLECALHTLRMMERGGMHDHVGKGFHRYSTDARWHVPHFEKMLYDQGLLAATYSSAYQVTGDPAFKDTVEDILLYVSRDLSDKDGGFYSAEDADSLPSDGDRHKKEGAFCVWAESDIRRLLTDKLPGQSEKTAAELFIQHYCIKKNGNVDPKQDPHDELKGQNVLIVEGSLEDTAAAFSLSTEQAEQVLAESREILYKERQKRPKPHRDNKILTAWNGLMLSGFACAARALDKEDYTKRAEEAARFVRSTLYNAEKGTLLRNAYRDERGELSVGVVEGFADDYSFLIRGLLDLFDVTQDPQWAEWANQLQWKQLELFWDEVGGGLFNNTDVDPSVLLRLKEDQDGAEPSPSSVAAFNLLRMGALFDSQEFKEKAKVIFSSCKKMLEEHSVALCQMCVAFMDYLNPPTEIVICGSPMAEDTRSMMKCVHRSHLPSRLLVVHDGSENNPVTKWLPPVRNMTQIDGKATAYVCKNFSCSQPVNTVEALQKMLQQEETVKK